MAGGSGRRRTPDAHREGVRKRLAEVAAREPAGPPPGRRQRRGKGKDEGGNFVNLFTGLLRNARARDTYVCTSTVSGDGRSRRLLINSDATYARLHAKSFTFPYPTFERAVLSCLREVKPSAVLGHDKGPDEVAVLEGELALVKTKRDGLVSELVAKGTNHILSAAADQLVAQEKDLLERLTKARAKAVRPLGHAWHEAHSLIDVLDKASDPRDARLRLRDAIRSVVREAWLLVVARGHDRLAAVQVRFAGGGQREYVIWHSPPKANADRRTPGWWRRASVRSPFGALDPDSPAALGLVPFALGDPVGVRRTEELLSLPLEDLEALFGDAPRHPLP
ncbi:MAG TPA: hypothetical protein VJ739_10985 [Gemmataceae bacterium]|nr:hypothetical protein [Gemmataceae bacterium]